MSLIKETPVLLAHGLDGNPLGRKASALREAGLHLICPDARGKNLAERIHQFEPIAASYDAMVIVGSSYGGLVALWLAQRFPTQTIGLVLCAPALQRSEAPVFNNTSVSNHISGHIIHGIHDRVVPASVSQDLASTHPHLQLELVDDDHSLRKSTPKLIQAVKRFIQPNA